MLRWKLPLMLLCCWGALASLLTASPPEVGTHVQVTLNDGARLRAEVARVDDQMLWLKIQTETMELLSGYRWQRIAHLEAAEQPAAVDMAPQDAAASMPVAEMGPEQRLHATPAPKVASLRVIAWLDNLDANAGLDGLRVVVIPLDRLGRRLSVQAKVTFELSIDRVTYQGGLRALRDQSNAVHQFWSAGIGAANESPEGFLVTLPFRGLDVERTNTLSPWGLLKARLSIPGDRAYEAVTPIEIPVPGSRPLDLLDRSR